MKTVRLIIIVLFLMPFLFTIGTIASSAETIGPASVGNYYIQVKNIADFGKALKSATEGIVMLEIDIARNIILYIKEAKPLDTYRILHSIKALSAVNA